MLALNNVCVLRAVLQETNDFCLPASSELGKIPVVQFDGCNKSRADNGQYRRSEDVVLYKEGNQAAGTVSCVK